MRLENHHSKVKSEAKVEKEEGNENNDLLTKED